MESSVYKLKRMIGHKVDVEYDKEEYIGAIFEDFDRVMKFVFLRLQDGTIKTIWFPGAKRFNMKTHEPVKFAAEVPESIGGYTD